MAYAVTLMAIAAGCASGSESAAHAPPSGKEHNDPTADMASLRAAYITGVQAEASEDFRVNLADGVLRALNRTQQFVSEFAPHGVILSEGDDEKWALSISTDRYGCAGDLRPLTHSEPKSDNNRVEYKRAQEGGAPHGMVRQWSAGTAAGLLARIGAAVR